MNKRCEHISIVKRNKNLYNSQWVQLGPLKNLKLKLNQLIALHFFIVSPQLKNFS